MSKEFSAAIKDHQAEFDVRLDDAQIYKLNGYFEFIEQHNPLLHLIAPCSAEEFAVRHVLESLTLLEQLPHDSTLADIGPGAGFPSIPCLLVRDDLKGRLIESKEKKAKYLETPVERLGLQDRVVIVNRQFEEADPGDAETITCRALDKFADKLPRMLKWAKGRSLLLFGGPNLREVIAKSGVKFKQKLMPMSEQRYLFTIAAGKRAK